MSRRWTVLTLTGPQLRALGTAMTVVGVMVLPGAWLWAVAWAWIEPVVVRPEMVVLPGGTFLMGNADGEAGRENDERQHEVTLSPFLISRTEVTQGMYRAVVGALPSACDLGQIQSGDALPVHCVSWTDAVAFCDALSSAEGLVEAERYRLPTEAEWEYAARAGAGDVYAGTSDPGEACAFGNVADAAAKETNPDWQAFDCDDGFVALAPVGVFRPNAWGLYDMTGNVLEWTADWYASDYGAETLDPRSPPVGSSRGLRGGSFAGGPAYARVANRSRFAPSWRLDDLGFRVARSLRSAPSPSGPLPEPADE